jgi:hypothetical protein
MKIILAIIAILISFSGRADACTNLSGIYASISDLRDQRVFVQTACDQLAVTVRLVGDPLLGDQDLTPTVMTVGKHPADAPFTFSDNYRFVGAAFVSDAVGYAKENGKDCTNRHIYSLDRNRNLLVRNQYFCDPRVMILNTESTLRRL